MSAAGPTEAETGVPPGEPLTSTVHNVHTASAVIDPPISASVGAHSENAEKAGSIHGSISDEDDDDLGKDFEGGTKLRDLSGSEATQFPGIKREHWWQIWRPRHSPPPPRATLAEADVIPVAYVSLISILTFSWVTPMMMTGYQRPLQATDLWKMDPSREAEHLSVLLLEKLEQRKQKADRWNQSLATRAPSKWQRLRWSIKAIRKGKFGPSFDEYGSSGTYLQRQELLEREWRQCSGKREASLTWALNEVFPSFWWGGLFKVAGDLSQMMTPLVTKALIKFAQETYNAEHPADGQTSHKPNIGRGIGMAFGLWGLVVLQSVCQHQFFYRSMATGVLARGALISAIYKKSLRLTVGARALHPNGKLMNHLSSDISRVDYCAQWFHAIWTAPIQLSVTLILICLQVGASGLVGFALFVLLGPLQTWFMQQSFKVRKKSMAWTDRRANLLRELLSSMQIIKVFTYEIPFLKRLRFVRHKEMVGIRKILIIRAANQAMAFSVPTLAAVLAFVTYASTHPTFNPALIFTALSFFNLLRQPLMFLPRALSSLTDAQNAVGRLTEVFAAETMDVRSPIDPGLDVAIRIKNATFSWIASEEDIMPAGGRQGAPSKVKQKDADPNVSQETLVEPFSMPDLNITVPRGRLAAIVGPVGSGKSSLLQGMIGEMNTTGSVTFGGRIAYCQQNAWIQNATLRENVIFGQAWDEHRYWQVIKDANLVPDLEILPDGDLTEIGEKGVNLSGGQKQRVNIARALYFDADIVLFDDPLSAVDAHVGKNLFENAICGLRARGKTVLLVTHALHFLPQVDYIYALQAGQVVEEGTYSDLVSSHGPFSRMVAEFGGEQEEMHEAKDAAEEEAIEAVSQEKLEDVKVVLTRKLMGKAAGTGKLEGRLMQAEKRKTGSIGRRVYSRYLHYGKARYTSWITLLTAAIMQGSQVMSGVWLTYWQSDEFSRPYSFYAGMYAFFGLSQAVFTFAMGTSMGILSYLASNGLHRAALQNVFYSPMSVFETQPLGRILGVFGKDIDTIDNQLADSLRMAVMTGVSLLGSAILITVYLHYFIVVLVVVGVGYFYFSMFYRQSAREVKRLDSLLRGLLYAHFSESLSGLATIRAYGETDRFIRENTYYMDLENRAYFLTTANQRWLAIRLDFTGGLIVFAVAIMCAEGGGGLKASEIALCLTYMVSIVQILSMVTRQSAEVENNMNAVERVLWYADLDNIPQEPPHEMPDSKLAIEWPQKGEISFREVVMSYRKGLPAVLKGISMDVRSAEKIGIIGRTGAGKTSITVALYRLTELMSGTIKIDGVDISTLGLRDLRSRIAIIPQDPVLFSGTLRSNLDPFDQYDDIKLYDAMKRACLMEQGQDRRASTAGEPTTSSKRFTLDTVIEDEGLNLSVGERSLVSLARALVKDSKIVVLDEATAAVDFETDAKIQSTIHREFHGKTLLCIAHRLRTIISWDRILVMNSGTIEEFDTPLHLFETEGLFRSMCDRSGITKEDIVRARQTERLSV